MALKDKPLNTNFLNPHGYVLVIRRLPFTTFYCQEVMLPSVDLPPIMTGNPFIKLNFSSTEIDIGRLAIRFKVDEDMKNYMELLNWIKGLGFPEDFSQYRDNKATHRREAIRSDASLIIMTSEKVPNIDIRIVDLVPVSLGSLEFGTTDQEVDFVTATAFFSVRDFVLEDIDETSQD